jgi:hypothetical protein
VASFCEQGNELPGPVRDGELSSSHQEICSIQFVLFYKQQCLLELKFSQLSHSDDCYLLGCDVVHVGKS